MNNRESGKPLAIIYPRLHPVCNIVDPEKGIVYLNPGVAEEGPLYYTPDSYPLSKKEAQAYLAQSQQFMNTLRKPSELSLYVSQHRNDFYADTSKAIESELRSRGAGKNTNEPDSLKAAQMVLLLHWQREEDGSDIQVLEKEVEKGMSRFSMHLGLEEDEHFNQDFILQDTPQERFERVLLEAFLRFLPDNTTLIITDLSLKAVLEEEGVIMNPIHEDEYAPDMKTLAKLFPGSLTCRETVGKLMNRRNSDPLDKKEVQLLFPESINTQVTR